MNVALINTNRIKPPIAPIGLDYVAEALSAACHTVSVLDLCWSEDQEEAVKSFFASASFSLVGLSLRNTDDCAFTSKQSFLGDFAQAVAAVRKHTDAILVMGGAGFSVMPESVLSRTQGNGNQNGPTVGVWGEGEFAIVELANRLARGETWSNVPNLVVRQGESWVRNLPSFPSLEKLPPMTRSWFDNQRYFREGGQAGIETKRGCNRACIYCADPVSKGNRIRLRPPDLIANELENLQSQGIDHIHTCDSEFNLPESHGMDVCRQIVRRRLGDRLRWYAYCSPAPFSRELAQLMRQAGCVGINFGVDSGDSHILNRLGRRYGPEEILSTAHLCREVGITVMFDLLVGGPGESEQSIINSIELIKRAGPDQTGISVGLRIYPGTPLWQQLGHPEAVDPAFYVEPQLESSIFDILDRIIGHDQSFFFFDPARADQNYNYNANERLANAILNGSRGAYWDILRKLNADS